MLVLKIKEGQKIYVDGGKIEVMLANIESGAAVLGFTAPSEVKIMRAVICAEGPARCCRCGGTLPMDVREGRHVKASGDCAGVLDVPTGRCGAFVASKLWGDVPLGAESEGGAA